MFKKVFEESKGKNNTTNEGDVNYSIVALENGNVYVTASRNVITGRTKAEQRKNISDFFTELLDNTPSLEIHTIEGDVLTITKAQTADKARDDFKTIDGNQVPITDQEFLVKLHVESHIDEIVETSKEINKNKKKDNKNHSFAKDGFTYRKAYFEDFDGQYYEITLSIGHNGTVATVYNIGKIKESAIPSAKIIAGVGSKPLGTTLSANSISPTEKNATEFSNNSQPSNTNDTESTNLSLANSDFLSPKTKNDITGKEFKVQEDISPAVNVNQDVDINSENQISGEISKKIMRKIYFCF